MYAIQDSRQVGKKRGREDDDNNVEGFMEHRSKRTLAIRTPELRRQQLTHLFNNNPSPRTTNVADITPYGSDSEDVPQTFENKSAFSPWSSSPAASNLTSSHPSPSHINPRVVSDIAIISDDMEMEESYLQPGSFHNETTTTISARIPTPINAQFSHQLPSQFSHSMTISQDVPEGNRRLPSPISEGETTPSVCVDQEDSVMDMDGVEEKITPKRGHVRSKHSLRNWTGFSPEAGGVRKFSMGYKADCDKCRNRVPGHFSHIITYPNGYS